MTLLLKKISFLVLIATCLTTALCAQSKYFTKTGKVDFYSNATLEDIEAKNNTVTVAMDGKTGALQFAVQMKGFEFEKKAMQDHFNDRYVESEKFPKSEFTGVITNNKDINYKKDGTYDAKVKGKLTLHGITKDVEATGTARVSAGKVLLNSVFYVVLADYEVKSVKDKVADKIRVTVNCELDEVK